MKPTLLFLPLLFFIACESPAANTGDSRQSATIKERQGRNSIPNDERTDETSANQKSPSKAPSGSRKSPATSKPTLTIAELRARRQLSPRDAKICLLLAEALELEGQDPASALAYYQEAEKLDPDAVGKEARLASQALRQRWLRVVLEDAEEQLNAKSYRSARKIFEDALELGSQDEASYSRARSGFYRAASAELIKSLKKSQTVVFQPLAGAQTKEDLGFAAELEQWLFSELNKKSIQVLAPINKSQANFIIRGALGQRMTLQIADCATSKVLSHLVLRRIPAKSTQNIAISPDPIELNLRIEAQRDRSEGGFTTVPVFEESVLYSGDRLRFFIRVNQQAWIYIFLFDSQGHASLLFPGTENYYPELRKAGVKTLNPAKPGAEFMVPPPPEVGKDFWFYLDDKTGRERVYVAASLLPLKDLETLCKELEKQGSKIKNLSDRINQELSRSALSTRFRDVRTSVPKNHYREVLTGRGVVVRSVSFNHRKP